MKKIFFVSLTISLMLMGCAVKTNPGMTMSELNNASALSGNGNLVLVSRAGDFEIYQTAAVLDWKRQISQGNQIAKSILTPDKNVYYVTKGSVLQQEIVGDTNINSFIAKNQPPAKPVPPVAKQAPTPAAAKQAPTPKLTPQSAQVQNLIDTSSMPASVGSCESIMQVASQGTGADYQRGEALRSYSRQFMNLGMRLNAKNSDDGVQYINSKNNTYQNASNASDAQLNASVAACLKLAK